MKGIDRVGWLFTIGLLMAASNVGAAVNVSITESAGSVNVESNGTINSAVCSFLGGAGGGNVSIDPTDSKVYFLGVGTPFSSCTTSITAPSTLFGTGGSVTATSSSGVKWGIRTTAFFVPTGFSSSTSFAATATYAGTLSSLGLTPGTYTYTLSNSGTSDTVVITVNPVSPPSPPSNPIPTLGEWARLIMMLMMIGAAGWQTRRVMRRH